MRAIYKRELRSYFQSMTGCVFVAFLVIFTGIYFTAYNLSVFFLYAVGIFDRVPCRDSADHDEKFFGRAEK